jgi:hypothetical protein
MRRGVIAGLAALVLVLGIATIVKAKCPEKYAKDHSTAMLGDDMGCHEADPNNK